MHIRPSSARLAAVAMAAMFLVSPATAQQAGGEQPPQAVTVVTLEAKDTTLTSTLPGRVTASRVAEVRPQVSGIITERLFEEGRPVKSGDILYRIDAASYEAQVAATKAALAQSQASLKSAEQEYTRQQTLLERSVASQQDVDRAISERDTAAAAVQVAEANLLAAQIDLERTTIRAPLDGVAGFSQVTEGALVTSGQATALTTIRALDPVYVDVTQSAAEILEWRRNGGAFDESMDQTVVLHLADGSTYEETGKVAAAEPHVNELTGVVVLRLEFAKSDQFLLPGMYVQVELPQGVLKDAILAPQEGITRDRRGQPLAMLVNAENKVEQRQITIRGDQGAYWVVSEGLSAGDKLIVAGFQKIGPGMTVTPEERQEEAGASEAGAPEDGAEAPADDQSAAAE